MTTTDDPREDRDDLGMARRADLWPRWPFLFVKKAPWQVGALMEDGDTLHALPIVFDSMGQGQPIATYDSLEALFADGWRVD